MVVFLVKVGNKCTSKKSLKRGEIEREERGCKIEEWGGGKC